MIKGKIEKGVPYPPCTKAKSTFHAEIIKFLDKLEIGDSVIFDVGEEGYNFQVKARTAVNIYSIIKGSEFVGKWEEYGAFYRLWRIR